MLLDIVKVNVFPRPSIYRSSGTITVQPPLLPEKERKRKREVWGGGGGREVVEYGGTRFSVN